MHGSSGSTIGSRRADLAEFYARWRDPLRRGVALAIGDVTTAEEAVDEAMAEYVPRRAELVYGDYAIPDPANPPHVVAAVAAVDDGGFTGAITVTVYATAGGDLPTGTPITIGGRSAVVHEGRTGAVVIEWIAGDRRVSVRSAEGDIEVARSVAESVRFTGAPFGDAVFELGGLPDGYSMLTPPRLASMQPFPHVVVQMPGAESASEVITLEVVEASPELVSAGFGSAVQTEVAGRPAYLVRGAGVSGLVWVSESGATVSVIGGVDEAELGRVADGVRLVTEDEWRRHYDTPGPQLPTTTIAG